MASLSHDSDTSEEEIVKELCTCNGLNYGRLSQERLTCSRLEMFFSGFSCLNGLSQFPNLQHLCIVGQQLEYITGLEAIPKLKELWISECQLQKIQGLENVRLLKKLYLYSNQIKKIENVDHLLELEILWLNDNKITVIQGLSGLLFLRELNLAENNIEKIGNSLNGLQHLQKLELSGNKLYAFKDLTNLSRLPSLQEVHLKSAIYRPSPLSLLCNYPTHLLYHLPQLTRLDACDVNSKATRDMAEVTVNKKKMYYNMKLKTIRHNLSEMQNRLALIKEKAMKGPSQRLSALMFAIKEISRQMRSLRNNGDDTETHESDTESDKDAREARAADDRSAIEGLRSKQRALRERVHKWERKCDEVDHYHHEALANMQQAADVSVQRLVTELETGGNVRFEDGRPSDPWFSSCQDLILSRFCAANYKDFGVVGIKIHRVSRVHNRYLRFKFDDQLTSEMEDDDLYYTRSPAYKKLLEYLFWIWDPEIPGGLNEPHRIAEEGFIEAETYRQFGKSGAVPLANSLILADRYRIQYHQKHNKGKDFIDLCPFRYGQLIVAKAYIGKSTSCLEDKRITKADFPNHDAIFKPRKDFEKPGQSGLLSDASACSSVLSSSPTKPQCDCCSRQCEWFIFNRDLVLPEYIIDFEYITRFKPKSPFTTLGAGLLDNREILPISSAEMTSDDDVLTMEPQVKPRPRLIALTEELILKITHASTFSNIRVLDLHGNCLKKLKHLHSLPVLKKLIVSFNELTKLDEVSNLSIEYLDASFNKITTLEGFKNMSRLTHLDLSWNQLQNTRDDVSILRKHCPILQTLDLTHNQWQKPEGLRLRAIGRIKTLTKLNGTAVTESEATAALRLAAGSRISQLSLLAHARTDVSAPRSLQLVFNSQILGHCSRLKPNRLGEHDNSWYTKVTSLNLDKQHISKLSNLERLENLKWASFNDNHITKIEGLDNCTRLEELSLEHNCISKIEGLLKLTKLRKLSLGHNYVTCLDTSALENLAQLQYLSLEKNLIASLEGLQKLKSLAELYISNNKIDNIREVFCLKNLTNLLILDIYGNPVSTLSDNYRLFVIYHLKSLKALDGSSIEFVEGGQARDAFGGRLTQDFVAERLGHSNFLEVREMDFPQCNIRTVDLGNGEHFLNLRSVNLEHNNMTSFSGLIYLVNLRVLCLNYNHIECVVPRPKHQNVAAVKSKIGSLPSTQSSMLNADSFTPVLEGLEVLHLGRGFELCQADMNHLCVMTEILWFLLGCLISSINRATHLAVIIGCVERYSTSPRFNGIKDMGALQLGRLTSLKALFLQGNEISKVEGLDTLQDLRELVLDRNKIKAIDEQSFMNQWNLRELHLEDNRIRELSNLHYLENMRRLFLGMNRLQDMAEVENLESLSNLVEVSLVSNAVARRMLHRPILVYRMAKLMIIDGIPVSDEEKAKAELYFMDQQPVQLPATLDTTLPGIGQYKTHMPVKVTNMQLVNAPYYEKSWQGTLHHSDDPIHDIQKGGAKKRGTTKSDLTPGLFGNASPTKASGTLSTQNVSPQPGVAYANRSQHQISQVPFVPHQQSQGDYTSHADTTSRYTKNQRR